MKMDETKIVKTHNACHRRVEYNKTKIKRAWHAPPFGMETVSKTLRRRMAETKVETKT
jgi:hypothetical protein